MLVISAKSCIFFCHYKQILCFVYHHDLLTLPTTYPIDNSKFFFLQCLACPMMSHIGAHFFFTTGSVQLTMSTQDSSSGFSTSKGENASRLTAYRVRTVRTLVVSFSPRNQKMLEMDFKQKSTAPKAFHRVPHEGTHQQTYKTLHPV